MNPQEQIFINMLIDVIGPLYVGLKQQKRTFNREEKEHEEQQKEKFTFYDIDNNKTYETTLDSEVEDAEFEDLSTPVQSTSQENYFKSDNLYQTIISSDNPQKNIFKDMYVMNQGIASTVGYNPAIRNQIETKLSDMIEQVEFSNKLSTEFVDIYKQSETILGKRNLCEKN
jgi:hypothetical protein